MQKIKVSCVSYLNSAPFVYGITHHKISENIELSLDNPSECAQKLIDGVVDVGLIPIAAISSVPNAHQLTKWCIGANGPVRSVALFSEVPLQEIKKIYLDFQSVTSNLLTRILSENHWMIKPEFLTSKPGFETKISGTTAGIVIGDRALTLQDTFKYKYDLAAAWRDYTGLPFVFARWVSNKELNPVFLDQFEEALGYGLQSINSIVDQLNSFPGNREVITDYLNNNLSYEFDDLKQKGMEKFLQLAQRFSNQEFSLQL